MQEWQGLLSGNDGLRKPEKKAEREKGIQVRMTKPMTIDFCVR